MSWRSEEKRRIWLVGASSGIGYELARLLLQAGHRVALSARRSAPLEVLATQYPNTALVVLCDVTKKQSVAAAASAIACAWDGVDTVIYNAGSCEYLNNGLIDSAAIERVMATNFIGMVCAAEVAFPLLKNSQNPQFAGVSSSAAYVPLPRAEAYGASKAAMSYFLHSLRLDWRVHGIAVQVICPGFVQTPLTDKNDFAMPCRITAAAAAREILHGLQRESHEIHFPRRFTTALKLIGLLPLFLQQIITRRLTA